MLPIAGGEPMPVPGAVVAAAAPLWVVGETLYVVRRVGSNALNGIYSYTAGDAAMGACTRSSSPALGVAIASAVNGGNFTGIDDTFVCQA